MEKKIRMMAAIPATTAIATAGRTNLRRLPRLGTDLGAVDLSFKTRLSGVTDRFPISVRSALRSSAL